jgi:adenylate cyclase
MNATEATLPAADTAVPDGQRAAVPLRKRVRRLVMQLGPSRMAATIVFLVIAILIARFSWQMPLIDAAERALYDARATLMAPHVEQDTRITLVTYNDETLFNTGIRSPLDRTILANALGNLDQMGAKAIGIDIAFDSPRPDDDVLKAQLRAMQTPTWLAYAEQASNPNTIFYEQQKYLEAYIADVATAKTKPTSVLFRTDDDSVIRRWPDRPKNLPPLMSNALARSIRPMRTIRAISASSSRRGRRRGRKSRSLPISRSIPSRCRWMPKCARASPNWSRAAIS